MPLPHNQKIVRGSAKNTCMMTPGSVTDATNRSGAKVQACSRGIVEPGGGGLDAVYEACAVAVGNEGYSVNRLRPIARAWLTLPCRRMPRVRSCRSLR